MERPEGELSFSVRTSGEGAAMAGLQSVLASPGPGHQGGQAGECPAGELVVIEADEVEARLQIFERIGGGSTARVYRGLLDNRWRVAIKVLHPHAAQREVSLREFIREAQLLARLSHRSIVRLHALAHIAPNFGGLPTRRFTWAIITELLEGGTLTRLIQQAAAWQQQPASEPRGGGPQGGLVPSGGSMSAAMGAPSWAPYTDLDALRWALDVALALQYLHAQNPPVVHRDVKTDNVLLTGALASGAQQQQQGGAAAAVAANAGAGAGAQQPNDGALGSPRAASGVMHAVGSGGALLLAKSSAVRGLLARNSSTGSRQGAQGGPSSAADGNASGNSREVSLGGGLAAGSVQEAGQQQQRQVVRHAKICDFGLHVVLDFTRTALMRRRSSSIHSHDQVFFQLMQQQQQQALAGSATTNRSARPSAPGMAQLQPQGSLGTAAGRSNSGVLPSVAALAIHNSSSGQQLGFAPRTPRSRRSSMTSNRGNDIPEHGLPSPVGSAAGGTAGEAGNGGSFSRQPQQRKMSALSNMTASEWAERFGVLRQDAAAAQAGSGTGTGTATGVPSRQSSKDMPPGGEPSTAPASAVASATLVGPMRSPMVSGPGGMPQGAMSGNASQRTSTLGGPRMSNMNASEGLMTVRSSASQPPGALATAGASSAGAAEPGPVPGLSAGQVLFVLQQQLHMPPPNLALAAGSSTPTERGSRLRPSVPGQAGAPPGSGSALAHMRMSLELPRPERTASGSSADSRRMLAGGLGSPNVHGLGGGTGTGSLPLSPGSPARSPHAPLSPPRHKRLVSSPSGADAAHMQALPGYAAAAAAAAEAAGARTAAGSGGGDGPPTSGRGSLQSRQRSNVAAYLAMMEEDLQLDPPVGASRRVSSRGQTDVEPAMLPVGVAQQTQGLGQMPAQLLPPPPGGAGRAMGGGRRSRHVSHTGGLNLGLGPGPSALAPSQRSSRGSSTSARGLMVIGAGAAHQGGTGTGHSGSGAGPVLGPAAAQVAAVTASTQLQQQEAAAMAAAAAALHGGSAGSSHSQPVSRSSSARGLSLQAEVPRLSASGANGLLQAHGGSGGVASAARAGLLPAGRLASVSGGFSEQHAVRTVASAVAAAASDSGTDSESAAAKKSRLSGPGMQHTTRLKASSQGNLQLVVAAAQGPGLPVRHTSQRSNGSRTSSRGSHSFLGGALLPAVQQRMAPGISHAGHLPVLNTDRPSAADSSGEPTPMELDAVSGKVSASGAMWQASSSNPLATSPGSPLRNAGSGGASRASPSSSALAPAHGLAGAGQAPGRSGSASGGAMTHWAAASGGPPAPSGGSRDGAQGFGLPFELHKAVTRLRPGHGSFSTALDHHHGGAGSANHHGGVHTDPHDSRRSSIESPSGSGGSFASARSAQGDRMLAGAPGHLHHHHLSGGAAAGPQHHLSALQRDKHLGSAGAPSPVGGSLRAGGIGSDPSSPTALGMRAAVARMVGGRGGSLNSTVAGHHAATGAASTLGAGVRIAPPSAGHGSGGSDGSRHRSSGGGGNVNGARPSRSHSHSHSPGHSNERFLRQASDPLKRQASNPFLRANSGLFKSQPAEAMKRQASSPLSTSRHELDTVQEVTNSSGPLAAVRASPGPTSANWLHDVSARAGSARIHRSTRGDEHADAGERADRGASASAGAAPERAAGPSSATAARMASESHMSSMMGWAQRDQMAEPVYKLTGRAGTLMYMAPEVLRDEPYNDKVDVFSLGVVLYELLGRLLLLEQYTCKEDLDALSRQIAAGYRHPRLASIPLPAWYLIQQCWAQDPVERPNMPMVVRALEMMIEEMITGTAAAGQGGASGTAAGTAATSQAADGRVLSSGALEVASPGEKRSSGRSLLSLGSLGRTPRAPGGMRRITPRTLQPHAPVPGSSSRQRAAADGFAPEGEDLLESPTGGVRQGCGACGCTMC